VISSPKFLQLKARVSENVLLARDTYRIRLDSPELAAATRPGQFVMLRLPGTTDPLLGRPFALFDTVLDQDGRPVAVDIGYLVVGKMTRRLVALVPGDTLEVWGPLGNGFSAAEGQGKVALVAGGIGQTPFLAHARFLLGGRGYGGAPARRLAESVAIYYGVRTAALAAGVDDLRSSGAEVHLATDDGSLGFHGYVTQLLATHPRPDRIVGCGPGPMLHALADLAGKWNVPCDLSLETPMACGVGICFSCVARVKTADGWDYRRVCVDGPVFDAATLVMDGA
jgi:dihydroorotate dehydrogenase electron transfer subunit